MASFLTTKKRKKGVEVIHSSMRDNGQQKGDMRWVINKQRMRFSVDDVGYIDYVTDYDDYADDFEWIEIDYGISKEYDKLGTDWLGER